MRADDSLSAEEVAQYLQIAKNSVYQMAKEGVISSYRIGRKLRFTLSDVHEYLNSTRRGGAVRAGRGVGGVGVVGGEGVGKVGSQARGNAAGSAPADIAAGAVRAEDLGNGAGAPCDAGAGNPGVAGVAGGVGAEACSFVAGASVPQDLWTRASFLHSNQNALCLNPEIASISRHSLPHTSYVVASDLRAADLIAARCSSEGLLTQRYRCSSYAALAAVYAGSAHMAVTNLFDVKTNSYNVAYALRLIPGISLIVFRLYKRKVGFLYHQRSTGRFSSWGSLLKENVRLANRERGCGERVLLDQRLRLLDARSSTIEGYAQEHFGEQSVVHLIEVGASDVAVARESLCDSAACLRFTPLQDEWIDVVVVKTEYTRPLIRLMRSLMSDAAFKQDMHALDQGNIDALGVILYES